ncbi:hypothetical protein BS78_K176900 [Paspalum vaginatum]|uniref:Uncharacterized protein n=1 Tax=Paspalum vaginatum TaxID=158149 RepID=A0A9W7X959_9POAL|nr:hypothetical protein BS78_K176900 [Paspalum vaginatum]
MYFCICPSCPRWKEARRRRHCRHGRTVRLSLCSPCGSAVHGARFPPALCPVHARWSSPPNISRCCVGTRGRHRSTNAAPRTRPRTRSASSRSLSSPISMAYGGSFSTPPPRVYCNHRFLSSSPLASSAAGDAASESSVLARRVSSCASVGASPAVAEPGGALGHGGSGAAAWAEGAAARRSMDARRARRHHADPRRQTSTAYVALAGGDHDHGVRGRRRAGARRRPGGWRCGGGAGG